MTWTLHHGDCLAVMRELPDASVDAIVTDPPYGLGFMGKAWDALPPGREWAEECLRVLKPGGHLLAFGGSRTWHRLAVAVEDAGFEIRDSIAWLYGSGFPKSLDVSKAIDKARTEDLEPVRVVCRAVRAAMDVRDIKSRHLVEHFAGCHPRLIDHWAARDTDSQPSLPTWEQWETLCDLFAELTTHDAEVWRLNGRKGKPGDNFEAREVIGSQTGGIHSAFDYVRKGESGKSATFDITAPATPAAEQWQGWGTALKPAFEPVVVGRKPLAGGTVAANVLAYGTGALNIDACRVMTADNLNGGAYRKETPCTDGTASTVTRSSKAPTTTANASDTKTPNPDGQSSTPPSTGRHDGRESWRYVEGGAGEYVAPSGRWPANVVLDESQAAALDESRFFYVAKAPKSERPVVDGVAHPTVKPLSLMRWLVRLVTPPGGTVLEPFAGSGATVEACLLEGFHCIAIEREADYLPLIEARIARVESATVVREPDLFDIEEPA